VPFDHDVGLHSDDPDVKRLQIFLNTHGFPVSSDGPGSPGNEVEHFGPSTKVALEKFQKAHSMEITMPAATGRFDAVTRRYINALQP
jgi:peptidoglycan hydrolase-like protein with peptidoglycan-binding domain